MGHGSPAGDGELVVAGGRATAIGHVDGEFDDVAALLAWIEREWSAAGRALALQGCDLDAPLADDGPDRACGEHRPVDAAGAGPIVHHHVGSGAGRPRTRSADSVLSQRFAQPRTVVALPAAGHQRRWAYWPSTSAWIFVDRQPAKGATKAGTCGFTRAAKRAGDEPRPASSCSSIVPLCLSPTIASCGVHRPRLGLYEQLGQQTVPSLQ